MSRISDFNPKRNPICSNNRQGFLTVTAPFLPPGIFGRLSVVAAKHGAAQLYHGRNRRIAEYIVEAGAAGHFAQLCRRIFHLAGVDKVQVDAVLLLNLCGREQRLGAYQTVLVHMSQRPWTDVTLQRTQAHRTGACHDDQRSALFNTHFVVINTYLGVISGVKRTDRATHRLRKRRLVVSAGCSVNFMPGLNLS